jgi:hypothetical protein
VDGKDITALVRGQYGKDRSLLFYSSDFGQTWSKPEENDLPMAPSKIYAGTLSTGQRYVLYNLPCKPRRREIVIAVTRPGGRQFVKAWKICDEETKKFSNHRIAKPEFSYPCALEADGNLYVVYSAMKRNCVMAAIPIASLALEEETRHRNEATPTSGKATLAHDVEQPTEPNAGR